MKKTLILLGLALAATSHAHFLWASFDGAHPKQLRIELAELPGEESIADVAGKGAKVQGWLPRRRPLSLSRHDGLVTAEAEDVAGASLDYGILDRSADNRGVFLLRYYAKGATNLKGAGVKLGLKTEIVAMPKDGKLVLTILLDDKAAPGAELSIAVGDAKPVEAKADEKGQWSVDWKPGQALAARAMVAQKEEGEWDGKRYSLIRNYATLALGVQGPKSKNDPAAWDFLKQASEARASFPTTLLGFSADFSADVEGRTVSGHVIYDRGRDLSIDIKGGTDKDQDWVKGQIRSQILHRSGVPFDKGDGAYAITFTGSENGLGKEVAVADSMQSRYRIRGNEILEVDRQIGGERLVVCILDTLHTSGGHNLTTQMTVYHFTLEGSLKATEAITDTFDQRGGIAYPGVRRMLLTTPQGIATRTLTFSNLKPVL